MQTSLTSDLPSLLQKGAIVLLSCVDDAIVMTLGKLGVSLPGLQVLSTILITVSICFWVYRIGRFLYRRYRLQHPYPAA